MQPSVRILVHAILYGCCAVGAPAADDLSEPFVAGFDRFFAGDANSLEAGGRLLLTELSCTACHQSALVRLEPKKGPRLDGLADRLQPAWIRAFLSAPHAIKPGTTMPDLLSALNASERASTAQALVAYLSTLRDDTQFRLNSTASAPVVPAFWNTGDPQRGKRLYHQIGCIACHAPDTRYRVQNTYRPERELPPDLDLSEAERVEMGFTRPVRSVPHAKLPDKYDRRSLTFFLLDPLKVRPSGRMPQMKLGAEEAADIAAYLVPAGGRWAVEAARDDVVQLGRRLFGDLGCANCHDVAGMPRPRAFPSLAELTSGGDQDCLDQPPRGVPHFGLSVRQRQAIRVALRHVQAVAAGAARQDGSTHSLGQTLLQFNCYGCHVRDNRGGVGPQRRRYFETANGVDMGDEGRVPPPLDGVGDKFQPVWLKQILNGTGDVRPYMLARMPSFGAANVDRLHQALSNADQRLAASDSREPDPVHDTQSVLEAGRILLGAGCVQCHPLRGEALPGVVGIDLAQVKHRLRRRWFHEFLLNPAALKRRTRMPTFFAGGKSPSQDILEGHVDQQISAMWRYLNDVQNQPLPARLEREKTYDFELRPRTKPLILRTFMKTAGTHAIAVGFPQQVHFAWDAERARLALAWRGRFLDAHGTWFDRFTPLAEPLGEAVIEFPSGPPIANLADANSAWPSSTGVAAGYRFAGYRLDNERVPTFLYDFDRLSMEDRIEASPHGGGLTRRIRIGHRDSNGAAVRRVWFRAAAGQTIQRHSGLACRIDSRLTVIVGGPSAQPGELRHVSGRSDWIVPLDVTGPAELEVRYQWEE